MGTLGRPRNAGVPREVRDCHHHGPSEHSHHKGHGWRCMKCICEEQKLSRLLAGKNIRDDDYQANEKGARHKGQVCSGCWEQMPLTGVCDNCE